MISLLLNERTHIKILPSPLHFTTGPTPYAFVRFIIFMRNSKLVDLKIREGVLVYVKGYLKCLGWPILLSPELSH